MQDGKRPGGTGEEKLRAADLFDAFRAQFEQTKGSQFSKSEGFPIGMKQAAAEILHAVVATTLNRNGPLKIFAPVFLSGFDIVAGEPGVGFVATPEPVKVTVEQQWGHPVDSEVGCFPDLFPFKVLVEAQ